MTRADRHAPTVLVVLAGVAVAALALPLVALLVRAPWPRFASLLTSPEVLHALWLSLRCSLAATLLAVLFGVPLAAWLSAGNSRLHTAVRVLVTLPMVLPPVVAGVALLLAYGRAGVVGGPLEHVLGIALPFTMSGAIVAEAYVALPFLVLGVEGGLRSLDPRFAGAAATLGARPTRVFFTVTLPMIAPSLRAGVLVAWARALGEFGATITFAGNLAGETRTMPLEVFTALESEPDKAVALSVVLVATSAVILFLLRRRWFPLR